MREILFRGKQADSGKWVYGLISGLNDDEYGIPMTMNDTDGLCDIIVNPITIGMYTGLTDKNGKKIFEGDILEGDLEDNLDPGAKWRIEVVWGKFGWMCKERQILPMDELDICEGEVIGNVYDGVNLLEV